MTWFRVGGAGIPASLKNAMNAVFNKKFGTSGQNYPPNGWPDNVNLLGPLPEKTASGAIAHIEDGADGVPLKNWLVTLPASLDGYMEVNGVRSGKNLIDLSSLVDGYVNSNGTFNTNHTQGEMRSDFIPVLPNTVYYFSIVETTGTAEAWVGIGEYTDTNTSNFVKRDGYWRFTTSATTKYVVVSARNLAQATKIQLEIGNDPTTWEIYTPIEQYTATLGRTIYGGTADIVTGEGEDGYGYVDLGAFTWVKVTSNVEKPYFSTTSALNPLYKYMNSNPNVKCSNYSYGSIGSTGTANGFYVIASSYVRIRDDATENMTAAEFKTFITGTKLVYELATPETFTFTPITPTPETALGSNNFWADEGDSDVTYRADISLALQALGGGGRGLMGMMMQRPEEEQLTEEDPEEVSELEENIQNTEEQEGENDAR